MLWLWCRPVAAAPIQPLAQELPYAAGMALTLKKKEKINRIKYHFSTLWLKSRVEMESDFYFETYFSVLGIIIEKKSQLYFNLSGFLS